MRGVVEFRYQWVTPCRFESGHSHQYFAERASARKPLREERFPSWNRALVLKELELPGVAAEAFAASAKLGEGGWAREAGEPGLVVPRSGGCGGAAARAA